MPKLTLFFESCRSGCLCNKLSTVKYEELLWKIAIFIFQIGCKRALNFPVNEHAQICPTQSSFRPFIPPPFPSSCITFVNGWSESASDNRSRRYCIRLLPWCLLTNFSGFMSLHEKRWLIKKINWDNDQENLLRVTMGRGSSWGYDDSREDLPSTNGFRFISRRFYYPFMADNVLLIWESSWKPQVRISFD